MKINKKTLKKLIWPSEDYFDSDGGAKNSNETINRWIRECLTSVKKKSKKRPDKKEFWYSIHSGQGGVFVIAYKQETGKFHVTVHVVKSYSEHALFDVKL